MLTLVFVLHLEVLLLLVVPLVLTMLCKFLQMELILQQMMVGQIVQDYLTILVSLMHIQLEI